MLSDEVVGLEYVEAILGIKEETARKLCRTNCVPWAVKIGKSWRIHKPTFDAAISDKLAQSDQKFKDTKRYRAVPEEVAVSMPVDRKFQALLARKGGRRG